ncbi:MAG TPA: redoxin domain-containing protein, partial [Tepidisphaeraceae bacterium]|nr:redoxin domain-containing protein [Tepidisphaeraceae bacterium]
MPAGPYVIGDWVGDFSLPTSAGKPVKLSQFVGQAVVLLFFGGDAAGAPAATAACSALSQAHSKLAALNAPILAVRQTLDSLGDPSAASANWPTGDGLPFPLLLDTGGQLSNLYGAARARAVLVSTNGRIARIYEPIDQAGLADRIVGDLTLMATLEPPRVVHQQAPILLIPDVLPSDFCRKLIEVWETQGNQDSGFMVNQGDRTVGQYDYNNKIRRDHFIQRGTPLDGEARGWIARHIIGEVNKSFNYEVTRVEDMKIACYDAARGGFFRPHRDNTTGATAHRRFAVSMLLNDDYEGGYLR